MVGSVGEQKTKPTQSSVRDLRGLGLTPDVIACRSSKPLDSVVKEKLSMFCHVAPSNVIAVPDCSSVHHVPILLEQQGLLECLKTRLNVKSVGGSEYFDKWKQRVERYDRLEATVKIGVVGKYTSLSDSYLSLIKALQHGSLENNRKLQIVWIEAEELESGTKDKNPPAYKAAWQSLKSADGILVPGGFGERGTLGKILACQFARESKVPYFGICLGLQIAVIEFCRNVLGLPNANSTEFDSECEDPVVIFMPEISKTHMGGTMRLGLRPTKFVEAKSIVRELYGGKDIIQERHRHRYEVNTDYVGRLKAKGFRFVGHDEKGERMEIAELDDHPFFVAVQYHPELISRPLRPSPLFVGFVKASIAHSAHA